MSAALGPQIGVARHQYKQGIEVEDGGQAGVGTLEAAGGPIAIRCDRIEGLIDIAAADVKRTPLADGRTLRTVRSGTTVYQLIGGEAAAGLLAMGGGVG